MSTTIFSETLKKSEFVLVNSKNIYFETYGKGAPLIMLHGSTLSSKSWLSYVENFEEACEVYLID